MNCKLSILLCVLTLYISSCKKDDADNSTPQNNSTDHGYLIFDDTTYQFQFYNVSEVPTSSPSQYFVQPSSDYVNGFGHVMGMRFEKRLTGTGTIQLQNIHGANFIDMVVHDSPILNYGTYHYYCKSGEQLSYSVTDHKLKISGTNLTETDEEGNVIPGGSKITFVSQE